MTGRLCQSRSDVTNNSTVAAFFLLLLHSGGSLTAQEITLRWDPNSEPDLAGYHIYHSQVSGSGYVRLNSSLIPTNSFTDSSVQTDVTYYYVATAVNQQGLESVFSNEVSTIISGSNSPPAAQDDTAVTNEDTPIVINVLSNDSDPDADPLSVSGLTQGSAGSVTLNGNQTVTYIPNLNYNGTDSFTYTVSDGNGGNDSATVTVDVSGTILGSEVLNELETSSLITNDLPLLMGDSKPGSEHFHGILDELRIYNRVLTESEILTDMNTPVESGTPASPLAAQFTAANGEYLSLEEPVQVSW